MAERSSAVIGINLGNSYGSLACINQHGRADVIANEDGERQLATRIAFAADQVYIGNQATPQLVRNAPNVIDQFVNLLGVPYSKVSQADKKQRTSAQLTDVGSDTPGFEVEINGTKTKLSVHQVAVRYLNSLFVTAKEFLSGVPIAGCVLSYPPFFSAEQMGALKKAAEEAGLIALQLLPAPAAALAAYGLTSPQPGGGLPAHPEELDGQDHVAAHKTLDRNVVVLDMGGSSTDVTVVAARAGLYNVLSYVHDASLGGASIDDAMIQYFAKEFTKKTKIAVEKGNARAWAKLRNEAEVTKRALSASNSAQCSVESLAEGMDFSGPLNRMRLDMLAGPVYDGAVKNVQEALKQAGLEAAHVDQVILAGGSARLSGLVDALQVLFPEESSSTQITSAIDSDQVIARGCAIQAQALAGLSEVFGETAEGKHISSLPVKPHTAISELSHPAVSKAIGILVPAPNVAQMNGSAHPSFEKGVVDGKLFVPIIAEKTPLPARRVVQLAAPKSGSALLDFAEADVDVHVETIQPDQADDDEDDEPLEPEEIRSAIYKPSRKLGQLAAQGKGTIQIQIVVQIDGSVHIKAGEPGGSSAAELSLPAP